MAADIGAKLKVEGETSYSKAMRDAAKNTRALDAELKLAEAQFKATGDAEKYMSDKDKVLREQLDEQEKAVKAAKAMLEQLAKAGYEQNSTKVMEWRAKLANAEQQVLSINQSLAQNASAVEGTTDSYDDMASAIRGAADEADAFKLDGAKSETATLRSALEGLGVKFGWDGLNETLTAINEKINAGIKRAVALGKALWDAGVDATVWADEVATNAETYGVDPKVYQQWTYATRFIDSSADNIGASMLKLKQNIGKKSVLEVLAGHVKVFDTATGEYRNHEDVFWDTIDYLGTIEDATKRDQVANEVLGKSFKDLQPIINAGSQAFKERMEEAPVLTDKAFDSLTGANDSIEEMNAQLEALKLSALAYLAPIIQDVAEAISAASKSLKEYLDSDEGQAALTKLQEAVSGLLTDFTELDFGQILSDASEDITSFISGLASIIEDKDKVVTALKGIGIAIGLLKLSEVAAHVLSIVSNLKLLGVGGGAAAGAAGAAAGGGVIGAIGAKVGGAMSTAAGALALPVAAFGVALLPAALADNLNRAKIEEKIENIKNRAIEAAKGMGEEAQAAVTLINQAADALGLSEEKLNVLGQKVIGDVQQIEEAMQKAEQINNQAKQESGSGIISNKTAAMLYEANTNGTDPATMSTLAKEVVAESLGYLEDGPTEETVEDISDTLFNAVEDISSMQRALVESPGENVEGLYGLLDRIVDSKLFDLMGTDTQAEIGRYYTPNNGYGVSSPTQFTDAQDLLDTINSDLSFVWQEYVANGNKMPEGFAQGVTEGTGAVTEATSDMAQAGIDAANVTLDSHSPSRVFETIGENASIGLANGIYAGSGAAIAAAEWLAFTITDIMRDALQIHSPSKVAEGLGAYFSEGFAIGLGDNEMMIQDAANRMTNGISLRAPALPTAPGASSMGANSMPGLILSALSQMRVQIDGQDAGRIILPTIEDLMAEQVTSRRYE